MKLRMITIGTLVLMLLLSACSGGNTDVETSGENVPNGTPNTTSAGVPDVDVPEIVQWMAGIFKLEETELAVSPEQAIGLLPLLKAYRALSTSDTAAQAEIEAVISQLTGKLTTEQDQVLEAMVITQADLFEIAREKGIIPEGAFARVDRSEDGGFPNNGFPEGGVPEGGFSDGGPPGGGFQGGGGGGGFSGGGQGGGGFDGDIDPEAIATARAERGGGFANRAGLILLDPLIEFLESRAES